jgi:hypothetical protein
LRNSRRLLVHLNRNLFKCHKRKIQLRKSNSNKHNLQAQQQQHQQAQPPALAHPNQGQPPQLNMDEVKALGGGKADPNAPDQTVEPANGQPQQTPGQNMQPQQAPGQSMIPGGLR